MNLRFSDRIGKTTINTEILKEELSLGLVNSLWSVIYENILQSKLNPLNRASVLPLFYKNLWIDFFKKPVDTIPMDRFRVDTYKAYEILKAWYFKAKWFEKLNLIEFCSKNVDETFRERCNVFFKKEFSAYRFVNGVLTEINSEEEIAEIEIALKQSDKFKPIKTHIAKALELLANKESPDYRNSIKESISAVESLSKIIVNDDSTTLGKALSEIEKKHQIPNSIKSVFSSLYGQVSNEGGIRHALSKKDISINQEEAKLMLVICSAFTNYLISKI